MPDPDPFAPQPPRETDNSAKPEDGPQDHVSQVPSSTYDPDGTLVPLAPERQA
jgi:hypothetical protein